MSPTIGRIVHYTLRSLKTRSFPMIITHVRDDGSVNGTVFVDGGALLPVNGSEQGDAPGQWQWPEIPQPQPYEASTERSDQIAAAETEAELNAGGVLSINSVEAYIRTLNFSDNVPSDAVTLIIGNLRGFAAHVRKHILEQPMMGSEGYSLKRIADTVILSMGNTSLHMGPAAFAAMIAHMRKIQGSVGPVLMSQDNPSGWKLEELCDQIVIEVNAKNARLERGKPSRVSSVVQANNEQIREHLRAIRRLQEASLSALSTLGPDRGPTGKPRI